MSLESVNLLKAQHPSIHTSFKKQMRNYDDDQMNLRRTMIRNVPFLRKISPQLTNELLFLLRENSFDKGSFVVKHGDLSNKVNIIWKGQVLVEVFYNGRSHRFEQLNEGGCFCVFSAFSDDYTQIFDFKVT